MKNFKIILWSIGMTFLLTSMSVAQKVGSTSMQFLHVMPCARATALGDAYVVTASGAEAVFWNPAGLAIIKQKEISTTYINWIFDSQQGALSFAMPMEDIGAIGFQLQYVDFGEFEETSNFSPYIKNPDAYGLTGRTFHPFSYLLGLTYARNLTNKFSTGLSIKFAHESLFDGKTVYALVSRYDGAYENVNTWANGLLFDFGIHYKTGYRTVQIAASVQNFGANLKYAKESSAAPLLARFGIAADLIGNDALFLDRQDQRLGLEFDLFQPNDYDQQAHIGLESEFANTIALRVGYKINYDTEGLTLGAGFKYSLENVRLALDYSYGSIGSYLGDVQRISLGAILQ
jgi:hypothetical protein